MDEPQLARGQPRHGVVGVRGAEVVVAAVGLGGDVVAEGRGCDAGGAVRVEVRGGACVSKFGGREVGDGAAEAVADDDGVVGGVDGGGGLERGEDAGAGLEPAVVAGGIVGFWGFLRVWEREREERGEKEGWTYKPWWQRQRGQMSVGIRTKSRSAAQLRKE